MTLSDGVVAAVHEHRQFLCHRLDGARVLWVAVTFGKLFRWTGRTWEPFVPSAAQAASGEWRVSPQGPRTSAPRRKLGSR